MDRPYKIIKDKFGNEIKMPVTVEVGDWYAECKCGEICGGHYGGAPNDDDKKYVACPACGAVGEPDIVWKKEERE